MLSLRYYIDTELQEEAFGALFDFIMKYYLYRNPQYYKDIRRTRVGDVEVLEFTAIPRHKKWSMEVEVRGVKPLEVRMRPSNRLVPMTVINRIRTHLLMGVITFEESVARGRTYFAWVGRGKAIDERELSRGKKMIYALFTGNMMLSYLTFILASSLFLPVFKFYIPIAFLLFQFVLMILSHRILILSGDWIVDQENSTVHILKFHIPTRVLMEIPAEIGIRSLMEIREEIYRRTLKVGRSVDRQTALEVFSMYGIDVVPEETEAKAVNIYELTKSAVERFHLPMPRLAVVNTVVPNALSAGPSPRLGTILISTGLLARLDEDELLGILGHELSHLKNRDSLVLFIFSSIAYLLQLRLFPLLLWFFWFTFFPYLYIYLFMALIMGGVYFVSKILEARCDLESAIYVGKPDALARALKKLGFQKFRFEKISGIKIQDWFRLEPHPPISFRISRLEALESPGKIRSPLIQSMRDCLSGFFSSLRI